MKLALAGTARAGGALPPAATPADALVPTDGDLSNERRLLLTAGARATYRQAGVSPRAVPAPAAAPADATSPCSPGAARLLARLLAGEQADLLPEALGRLGLAGLRLPPALLPAALQAGTRKADLRPALLATLGERGRWLAGHNQPWRWATARPLADEGGPPADAEATWEEGLPSERLAILRLLRASDPALARDWLATAWKGERADFRAEALKVLEAGLTPGDEPFLEAALDDRGQGVRAEAARLLARLPGSALATRLRERADPCLAFSPGILAGGWRAAAKALVTGAVVGKLAVTPPPVFDKAWARDGIAEKPAHGTGERAWWLQQFLALIPPSHWSGRFTADPATLIAAAEGSDWSASILGGWSQAALLHRDGAWAAALWRHWSVAKLDRARQHEAAQLMGECIIYLPRAEAEGLVTADLARTNDLDKRLVPTLQRLPRPWSATLARALLQQSLARLQELSEQPTGIYHRDPWLPLLHDIALAMPPECFGDALSMAASRTRAEESALGRWWRDSSRDFADLVRTRQRLMEEIPL